MSDGHVFICYVRDDADEVDKIEAALAAAEIPVWRDTAELRPGDNWALRIRQAIEKDALIVIACFSKRGLARAVSYQYAELALAIEQARLRRPDVPWLIPVRFDECDIPALDIGGGSTLRSIQRSDLFGAQGSKETARLVETVRRILEQDRLSSADRSADASVTAAMSTRAEAADDAQPKGSGLVPSAPDGRWANISGGIGPDGRMRPMSFDILEGLASEWAALLSDHMIQDGPAKLLGMARSQFTLSWFNYEFMVTACLTGFQALEAAFRVLYPEEDRMPFPALIDRARREGVLPGSIADLADSAAEHHEIFSHPRTQTALTLAMSVPMMENTHRLVDLVMNAAEARDTAWRTQNADKL